MSSLSPVPPSVPNIDDEVLVFIPHTRREVALGVYKGPDPDYPHFSFVAFPDPDERPFCDVSTGEPLPTARFPNGWIKRLT